MEKYGGQYPQNTLRAKMNYAITLTGLSKYKEAEKVLLEVL